jgi:hypothetical protein
MITPPSTAPMPFAALIAFSVALFLSAALMFGIQPMTGKMLLPLVGGTPAGWIVAMSFFQLMLLGGYFLAHALARRGVFWHGGLYIMCLLLGAVFLPVDIAGLSSMIGEQPRAIDIVKILSVSVGAPFMALSATSSTLQRLFMHTRHPLAQDPYFLYVASNLGSFFGLLFYPLWAEPHLTLPEQSLLVTVSYGCMIALGGLCLWLGRAHQKENTSATTTKTSKATSSQKFSWMILAFFPSVLMSGVTVYITSDLVSTPMLWVLPLALYLLTFIIAFARRPIVSYATVCAAAPWVVIVTLPLMSMISSSWAALFMVVVSFFVVTLMCHMRLAGLRPLAEEKDRLTAFYLMMSVGGAAGGALNAFIFPDFFVGAYEYRIFLAAALMLHPGFAAHSKTALLSYLLLGLTLLQASLPRFTELVVANSTAWFLCGVALSLFFIIRHLRDFRNLMNFLCCLALLFTLQSIGRVKDEILFQTRNFYGVIKVTEENIDIGGAQHKKRVMIHGTTNHGTQIIDHAYETRPGTYFTKTGPFGDIIQAVSPRNILVLGLGVGSMNCHEAPGRRFTFIEINPAVADMAKKYFTSLSKCSSGKSQVIIGDGRLETEKMHDGSFDLIVMDAFTSDAIPTHLITREAFTVYEQKLKKNGAMAINISSRYFLLSDPIGATAHDLGLKGRMMFDTFLEENDIGTHSAWIILSRNDRFFDRLGEKGWMPLAPKPTQKIWTDSYSDLLSILSLKGTVALIE